MAIVRRMLLTTSALALLSNVAVAASFEQALEATYTNNPRIQAERKKLEATDEGVAQALSGFRPSLSAGYEKARQRTDFGNAGWSYGDGERQSLTVSQPIFRGGGTWYSFKSAQQTQRAGQYTLSAVEQNVLLEAITSYMDIIADSAILDLARNNEQVLTEQLKAADTRFQVGEVTRTDVAQSQARLSDAKSAVIAAEGRLRASLAAFTRVAGYRPEGTLTVPEKLPQLPATLEEALEYARSANPQLLAAIYQAKASQFDVNVTESKLLPTVSLVGSVSRQDGAGSNGNSSFNQDKVGIEVSIPLYQSGAEYARVREASAIARQRDHESIDTRMAMDEAVTQAWQSLETAIATITTREDQIKAAQIALDGVKQEQQYGSRTVLDVLDAEQELFSARTNLVRSQRDRVIAAYTLAFTLGQLTPQTLELSVAAYDPTEHADEVKWKSIGF